MQKQPKKKIEWSSAWREARVLIWAHRKRLLLGAVLMIINQTMGLVLPASTKYLIDSVIVQRRTDILWMIALAAAVATIIQVLTSFSLSQVLGVAAQRAITEMRKNVQAQISRLPISYFDSTQTGQLISRIMPSCEVCGNEYYLSFDVILRDERYTFDSFECAIQKLAPHCDHCDCRIIGHGPYSRRRVGTAQRCF